MIQMVKHVVDTRQLKDRQFLEGLFERADEYKRLRRFQLHTDRHKGKVVGSFFYQPSTRTKMSFDSAAKRLGAEIVGTENAQEFSSAFKGETLEHSYLATQDFFDAVVMRHPKDGAAKRAAYVLEVPFINAGDGKNQHPSQGLLDYYTVKNKTGRMDDLTVVFVGDIAQGRTIKSMAYLLAHQYNNKMYFVSPPGLGLPDKMRQYLIDKKVMFYETDKLDEVISEADVLYVTRMQFEYVDDAEKKKQLMDSYKRFQIDKKKADGMKEGAIIMHPLPINTEKSYGFPEITPEVDFHDKAYYFTQSNNGLYIRMALLDVLLTGPSDPLYNRILDVPKD